MVGHFAQCDADYGRRVAEGLGVAMPSAAASAAQAAAEDAVTSAGERDDADARMAGAHGD